jgi:hypothetical protein
MQCHAGWMRRREVGDSKLLALHLGDRPPIRIVNCYHRPANESIGPRASCNSPLRTTSRSAENSPEFTEQHVRWTMVRLEYLEEEEEDDDDDEGNGICQGRV